jgi:N-acetylmuramoyl-L-alanine amidase
VFFDEHMYKAAVWWYTVLKVHKLRRVMHMKQGKRPFLLLPLCALTALGALMNSHAAAISAQVPPQHIVVIDPGHGGEDGAALALSGKTESQINLEIALRTDSLCGLLGIRTKLLRSEDVSLADADAESLREKKRSDLKKRVELVNSLPSARLLSIHQNYFEGAGPHGAQVFYHSDEDSQAWAEALQESLHTCVDPDNTRTAVPVPEFVYLMRHIDCPAVLVECGFLSNPEENQRLESPGYQKKLAAVLAVSCLEQEADNNA